VFVGLELRQNTQAIQAQTRDSITEKQMEFLGWVATNRDLAEALAKKSTIGLAGRDGIPNGPILAARRLAGVGKLPLPVQTGTVYG